ncbi:hypothetical protein JD844_006123 [Phrynosoma platyrhinos]|uniref:Regulator of G protein signalling-like domain-containing protein n=1 Tax=Phrynosoma platyrhinos TaxID=52577 RepID=A0ABQ7TS87_PHRPL|nr:hypothetical protein JD844_006123 [Phrynosoma platyrhinos]
MELEEGYNGNQAPGARSGFAMAIIGAEDEDFENDIEPFQNPDAQSGLFQNLKSLKSHPAYLMVFVQHVVLQFDSSPVVSLVHLSIHVYRNRPELIPDDQQRKYLQEIQNFQEPEIARQLEDFREKRKMGMTPGESELFELEGYRTKDRGIREAKEKQLAELLLVKLEEMHLTISADEEKSSAIFTAIVTYMKHLGVKTKTADNKKSKANFFRKKISGAKKPEEAAKSKKGFSILDPARWNRGDSHSGDKAPGLDRKGAKAAEGVPGRAKGAASGSDPSGVSVSVHPPPGEANDGETGADSQTGMDSGDSAAAEQLSTGDQPPADDGAENER